MADLSPTVVQLELGKRLRDLREQRKLTIEERMLSRQFADDYPAYQREVKALVPFVL